MLVATSHFSFTVSSMERSKRFYGDILGLECLYELEHAHPYTSQQVGIPDAHLLAVGFRLGKGTLPSEYPVLELIEYVRPRGEQIDLATNNPGVSHLAFRVDDIFAERERLVAAGVAFRSEPVLVESGRNHGAYTAYLWDPDGITLELFQPPIGG